MADSDDTPEDDKAEAGTPAAKGGTGRKRGTGRKGPAGPVAAEDAPKGDVAAQEGLVRADAPLKDAAGVKGEAVPEEETQAAAPVAAGDAPKGDVEDEPGLLKVEEPFKDGPGGKGAAPEEEEISESEPAAVAEEREPAVAPSTAPERVVVEKRGFWAPLFGGVLAGLIGFGASWWIFADRGGEAELAERIEAQETRLAAAEEAIASSGEMASAEALAALEARVAEAETAATGAAGETRAALSEQAERLTAIAGRLDTLEKAPVENAPDPAAQAALEAYGREVAALREEVSARMQEIDAALEEARARESDASQRQEEAAAAARHAAAQQALLEVQAALETGAPYGEALGRIGVAELPEGLSGPAGEGVPTLDALKAAFPPAAREALKVSREETAAGEGGGFGAWITRQVGARSLEPKEGNDPDAVLSRAEAALNAGDLGAALDEIAALPPGGQEAMAGWVEDARTRHAALEGAHALAAQLANN